VLLCYEDECERGLTVGDCSVAGVTAAGFGADCVGHDDDFGVGGEDDVGEDG